MGFHVARDGVESASEFANFLRHEHARASELRNPGAIHGKVVGNQPVVDRERLREFFKVRVPPPRREAPAPELHFFLRFFPAAAWACFAAAMRTGSPVILINPSASFWL